LFKPIAIVALASLLVSSALAKIYRARVLKMRATVSRSRSPGSGSARKRFAPMLQLLP